MKTLSSTDLGALKFSPGTESVKTRAVGNKVGWLQTKTDQAGARFDIVIKDGLGRVKLQKQNCGGDGDSFGELVNMPTLLGEELEVSIENLKGAKNVEVFLN